MTTDAADQRRASDAAHEARLMARIADGDRGAPLEELYDRYARRIHALGTRKLRDRALADDLVQETFLRLWRAAPRFDPERGTVSALLFTIAHRAAADLSRRRAGQPATVSLDADVAALGGRKDVGEQPSAEEQILVQDELQAALSQLSEDHRAVLRLHFSKDLTQQQTADELGVPLGTVKTRIFYALRQLRDIMEGASR